MPEITLLGWIHTGVAVLALISGFYTLAVHKVIKPDQSTGLLYIVCTFIAASTALMIYKHGGFGPGHSLAVLTLLALAAGFIIPKLSFLGGLRVYLVTLSFSITLLFHMIPAITDGLLRLPVGDPVLTDPKDPLLLKFYLAFFLVFLVGYVLQVRWIRRQSTS